MEKMETDEGALPAHDELGLVTRLVELASIVVAVGLLAASAARLVGSREQWTWWMLPAIAIGMTAADLVSGIVHWFADTWGSETMPILGRRLLRPFRVHHVNPDDFLRRNWIDTNGDVAAIVAVVLAAALVIPINSPTGAAAAAMVLGFCAVGLPTNQVHQWAHMPRPPRVVRWLQRPGLLLSCEEHARHHQSPYVTNYCIATGWCNRPLVAIRFFPRLEWAIERLTGISPRADEQHFQAQLGAPESPT